MNTNSMLNRISRFDGYELDRQTGRLMHHGTVVPLPEQGFQVLAALLDQPGEPVSREALRAMLWTGDTVGDFDNKLNGVVRKIRIALGEDAEAPRYVETLPRRGYRFIGAIEPPRQSATAPKWWPARRLLTVGGAAMGIILLVAAVANLPGRERGSPPRLAVLPFDDRSFVGDAGEILARNLTDEVTHQLTRLDPSVLTVLAPETGRQLRGSTEPSYRPDYVVTGSVEHHGDSLRLLVQLTRQPAGSVLWSETFESTVGKIAVVHRDVAERVARQLRVPLVSLNENSRPVPDAAMDSYWRGRLVWARGTPIDVKQSIQLFQQALSESPEFVAALVGLADAYNTLALTGGIHPRNGFDSARTYAQMAIDRDDQLADAYTASGLSLYLGSWAWEEATRVLQRAVSLQPGRFEPHAYLASIHSIHGRHDDAIVKSRIATRHNPLAPATNADLAWYYYYASRYDDAVQQIAHVRKLDPSAPGLDLVLALTQFAAGHEDEALRAVHSLVVAREGQTIAARLDSITQANGTLAAWHWWLQRAVDSAARAPRTISYLQAVGSAILGDTLAALETIERAATARVSWAPFVAVDPAFQSLAGSLQFKRLTRQMGLH